MNSSGTAQGSPQYLEETARGWAEYFQIENPPPVDVVRFVNSEESQEVMMACMTEEGFPEVDGGWSPAADNEDSFFLARYTCAVRYPRPERYAQEWTDTQLKAQYRWTIDYVIPCLESRGHPISPPPTEAAFLDSWDSRPYFPFSQVRLAVPGEQYNSAWAELGAACIQQAPDSVMWDGVSPADWAAANGRRF